jgi:Rps23 Pro-64 3,4-dihydroxylase Tpa1-like proline 4-hydroxylase
MMTNTAMITNTATTTQPTNGGARPPIVNSPTPPRTVKLKILLAGGHQHELMIAANDPLLHQLFTLLVNQTQSPNQVAPTLLQIPTPDGQRAMIFSSANLVGLVTEPPVLLQRQDQSPAQATAPTAIANAGMSHTVASNQAGSNQAGSNHAVAAAAPVVARQVLPADRYIQLENFFPPEFHQQLLDYAITNRDAYTETGPDTNSELYKDHRNSLVIYYPQYTEILLAQLQQVMPQVLQHLELPPFTVDQIEAQLTAHNDGNYYKTHSDNSSAATATRQLTYVYYFYQEPKAFSGGELVIYETELRNGHAYAGPNSAIVMPKNNSIVFFPSHYLHEVRPVKCASRNFADSRFTLNGWIRRAPEDQT